MYDLSSLINQSMMVINAALVVIDPSTPIGALVHVSFGASITMMTLRLLARILPHSE